MPPKVLVTGSNGQLGSGLMIALEKLSYDARGVGRGDFDITNKSDLSNCINGFKPDIVFHTASYTNVDDCEANKELALSVNAEATKNIAIACSDIKAKLFYYSTDYVFDGTKNSPYIEGDKPNPINVYGQSKLLGEQHIRKLIENHIIIRTTWLYGNNGKNFVKAILKKAISNPNEIIKVVDDQIGNPTWTEDVINQSLIVLDNKLTGTYHCSSEGQCSWYDFARLILKTAQIDVEILPCLSDDYKRTARRPAYSSLENKALNDLGLNKMKKYEESFNNFFTKYGGELLKSIVR